MGNSAREIALETYSVLPLTALGHTVIMVDGKVGTLRICGRVWSLKAKYLVFFTLKNKKQKKNEEKAPRSQITQSSRWFTSEGSPDLDIAIQTLVQWSSHYNKLKETR